MAYDDGLAQLLRDELADVAGVSEKRMFGGLCFLLNGNMLCGVHKGGGMFRVGKDLEAAALQIDGTGPMTFTGRKMGGMVDVSDELLADETRMRKVMELAHQFVGALPAK
ncbi:MAG: TfoX/Sxy family protein [Rhodobacteraceae bacterium]|nr:TfoX/Sxy family protein [Paracoccaceae bacterium]